MKKQPAKFSLIINFNSHDLVRALLGPHDHYLRIIEEALGIVVVVRGTRFYLTGDYVQVKQGERVLKDLYSILERGQPLYEEDVRQALNLLFSDKKASLRETYEDGIPVPSKRRFITPRSPGQKEYIEAIRKHDMVFSIGPAGTGKTYLAMACAVSSLIRGEYERIILTRPAVEAGERLGFLPGSMQEKVNPYLRPLYDALHDMMDIHHARRLIEDGKIEVAPLAFMRGRTLNSSFVVLDEAQNCTREQMKMFLTRLGFDSKAVITGDITQIDLPYSNNSGLLEVRKILKGVHGICFYYLTEADVVRHRLVQAIIKAYEKAKPTEV